MKDGSRACLGFVFLIAALFLSFITGVLGWLVWDFNSAFIASLVVFLILAGLAAYMFVSIKDYAWVPAVLGGVYAILPDLLLGPADDAVVMVAGVVVSGIMAWRRGRTPLPPK